MAALNAWSRGLCLAHWCFAESDIVGPFQHGSPLLESERPGEESHRLPAPGPTLRPPPDEGEQGVREYLCVLLSGGQWQFQLGVHMRRRWRTEVTVGEVACG